MYTSKISNVARRLATAAQASTSAAPASVLLDAPKSSSGLGTKAAASPAQPISSIPSPAHYTIGARWHASHGAKLSSRQTIGALHTTLIARQSNPDSFERRREEIPTSAWSRPPRLSQDADDNTVPSYYVERKKQRNQIAHGKDDFSSLMDELHDGILSEGIAAQTRAREEKIPVEVRLPDGTVRHPSGFEPPTAETEFHPSAAKVATEEHPLLTTVKQPWEEREFADTSAQKPIQVDQQKEAEWIKRMVSEGNGGNGVVSGVSDIGARASINPRSSMDDPDTVVPPFYMERLKQRNSIEERMEEESGLMHELHAGLWSDEVGAHIRERDQKIPVEVKLNDGTVAHASGFVPPTAETDFHPVAAKSGDVPKQTWADVLSASQSKSA